MKKYLNFLFILIVISFIIFSGIHLFSCGFLLTRKAQTEVSTCDKYFLEQEQCLSADKKNCLLNETLESSLNNVNLSANICFPKKSKVIILMIDALKHEFGVYDSKIKDPLPYQNKLPIMDDLMKLHPENSRLLKFIADPPTTTLQRLKGLTTGSLPTFIDIGSNFASPEINEDNIIDQIVKHNLSTVFMGDSTWMDLFPKRFRRKYPHPSFNIQDLDSVDNANKHNLAKELPRKDWDVLIAHFLGVDHCGHKHGPLHAEMSRKLTEMNDVIKDVVGKMDDNTLLLVMGDHGMTITGDHGGDTPDEVEALLFAYSKGVPFVPEYYDNNTKTIKQIDIVPTLSAVLGVPVPFSNLGTISFQLLPDVKVENLNTHQIALLHLWQNAKQIKNYFVKYSEENQQTFSYEDLDDFDQKFNMYEQRVNAVYTEIAILSFSQDLKTHLDELLQMCKNVWILFNSNLMSQGTVITFLGIFTSFILIYYLPLVDYARVFNMGLISFMISANILVITTSYFLFKNFGFESSEHSFFFMTPLCNVVILMYLIVKNWDAISDSMSKITRFSNFFVRIVFLFSLTVFFSNSFIVQEQKILCYLTMGLLIHALYEIQKSSPKIVNDFKAKFKWNLVMKTLFFRLILTCLFGVFLLRISYRYFKCREEQNCYDFQNTEPPKKRSEVDLVPMIVLALFVTLTRIFLKMSGNLTGFSLNVLLTRYGPTVSVICVCGHFALSQNQLRAVPQIHIDALAWIVYALFILEVLVIFFNPLLIHIVPRTNDQLSVSSYSNMIPELFNVIKNVFNENHRNANSAGNIPIIYGLATVYSSVFIAFGVLLGILIAILLGVKVSNGLVILVTVAIILLILNSIARYESTDNVSNVMQPKFSSIVSWFILMSYGFYLTSHQPTISQIDWNAAFVGRTAYFDNSNIISATLVIISTFGSNILLLCMYPLLILFPFLMYAIYPTLSMKTFQKERSKNSSNNNPDYRTITLTKQEDDIDLEKIDFDVSRGEINLYENEKLFFASAFKVGCQFIILLGLKVLAAMMACTILCRHLMVWKIFAPRFIYEGITCYVSLISIIIGFALLIRVHSSVNKIIEKIYKKA